MKYFKLPQELGDKLVTYLASRPFIEVAQLIQALQSLEECPCDDSSS